MQSKYTVVLKNLLDDPYIKPLIDKAMSTYPLYEKKSNEKYIPSIVPTRLTLNTKILNHYKYREIGFETVGRFIDELEIALNEIMPYYNQLLFSVDQDYNILFNVDYERTIKINKEGTNENKLNENGTTTSIGSNSSNVTDTSSTNSSVSSNNKHIKSDTPQNELTVNDIDNVTHGSEVDWNKDISSSNAINNGTSESESSSKLNDTKENEVLQSGKNNEIEDHIETTKGNFGVMATQDLIKKYRELIINIEQDIILDKRIQDLFMSVY